MACENLVFQKGLRNELFCCTLQKYFCMVQIDDLFLVMCLSLNDWSLAFQCLLIIECTTDFILMCTS